MCRDAKAESDLRVNPCSASRLLMHLPLCSGRHGRSKRIRQAAAQSCTKLHKAILKCELFTFCLVCLKAVVLFSKADGCCLPRRLGCQRLVGDASALAEPESWQEREECIGQADWKLCDMTSA